MNKRAYILHRWHGKSDDDWYPWLKKELTKIGYKTVILDFPDSTKPVIDEWVGALRETIDKYDEETILVGHSIGCQTILRYLEKLPDSKIIKKTILVAPWIVLQNFDINKKQNQIIRPWLETPIDYQKVRQHCQNIYAIFSDNDHIVPIVNADMFKNHLNAKVYIEHDKDHFFATPNNPSFDKLPIALSCAMA